MQYRVVTKDAVKLLRDMDDASVDLIFTDPAYESLEKHRKVGTTTRLKKKWFDIFPNGRYEELFEQFYRVLKQDRHCYVTTPPPSACGAEEGACGAGAWSGGNYGGRGWD